MLAIISGYRGSSELGSREMMVRFCKVFGSLHWFVQRQSTNPSLGLRKWLSKRDHGLGLAILLPRVLPPSLLNHKMNWRSKKVWGLTWVQPSVLSCFVCPSKWGARQDQAEGSHQSLPGQLGPSLRVSNSAVLQTSKPSEATLHKREL